MSGSKAKAWPKDPKLPWSFQPGIAQPHPPDGKDCICTWAWKKDDGWFHLKHRNAFCRLHPLSACFDPPSDGFVYVSGDML